MGYAMSKYDNLLGHIQGHRMGHKLKRWLLEVCHREDANTIRFAVEKTSDRQFERRLARILAQDD